MKKMKIEITDRSEKEMSGDPSSLAAAYERVIKKAESARDERLGVAVLTLKEEDKEIGVTACNTSGTDFAQFALTLVSRLPSRLMVVVIASMIDMLHSDIVEDEETLEALKRLRSTIH